MICLSYKYLLVVFLPEFATVMWEDPRRYRQLVKRNPPVQIGR